MRDILKVSPAPMMSRTPGRAVRDWWIGGWAHLAIAIISAIVAVMTLRALTGDSGSVMSAPQLADVLMFAGIFAGVFAAAFWADTRVRTPHDIARIGRGGLLAVVPKIDAPSGEAVHSILHTRAGAVQEAFGRLYRAVKLDSKSSWPKIVAATSSGHRDGRRLVVVNFAASCARHGRRTLLIDADLRPQRTASTAEFGLVPWFKENAQVGGAGIRAHLTNVFENFDYLAAGGRLVRPADLLASDAFAQLLARCKNDYELIVVNTPPFAVSHDAVSIADRCDEILHVCEFNRVSRRRTAACLRALHNGKNEILGIVLNGVPRSHMEYFASDRGYNSYKPHYGASD